MISMSEARAIAAGWISPSPHDVNLTAFATGHPRWTFDGLLSEVTRNIIDVRRSPMHYDDAEECLTELRALRDWADKRGI